MTDTAERKAIEILDRIGMTGETPLYAQLVASISTAIREERDLFIATNRELRADWFDAPDAAAYADKLGETMLAKWRDA